MQHLDNVGHTETTITIHPDAATINVRMLPGYRSWSRPTPALIRRWVDENIAESGTPNRKRSGRVGAFTSYSAGWYATVALVEA